VLSSGTETGTTSATPSVHPGHASSARIQTDVSVEFGETGTWCDLSWHHLCGMGELGLRERSRDVAKRPFLGGLVSGMIFIDFGRTFLCLRFYLQ